MPMPVVISSGFNSRTPCGVRLLPVETPCISDGFNSRTPCGVRLVLMLQLISIWLVSIHAPRAGCDYSARTFKDLFIEFQFTHPVRGATVNAMC